MAGASYDVGYGKPPGDTRFKKGVSGNPRGRPNGAKAKVPGLSEERMKALVLEEAYRSITVRDGLRNVTVPIAQAVLRSLAVNAVKGQHPRAAALCRTLVQRGDSQPHIAQRVAEHGDGVQDQMGRRTRPA